MNLELHRDPLAVIATIGALYVGDLDLVTLEPPWVMNPEGFGGHPDNSCVPVGEYILEPHHSARKGDVWALVNHDLGVYHWPDEIPKGQKWGRSTILMHVGNSLRDTEGCLLIGERAGMEAGKPFIYKSVDAIKALRAVLGIEDKHKLSIRETDHV